MKKFDVYHACAVLTAIVAVVMASGAANKF